MGEIENIKQRYENRNKLSKESSKGEFYFSHFLQIERKGIYSRLLQNTYGEQIREKKMIEIGAGSGSNLDFFLTSGFSPQNIWANELLQDRYEILTQSFPDINCVEGDATLLNFENYFDLVFQSTVFTSILDKNFKQILARKMMKMLKPEGMILWYDFAFDNPKNKDVKGISKKEIKNLFSDATKIVFKKVTLAPPIGRRVYKNYNLINKSFPFLRTHIVALIYK